MAFGNFTNREWRERLRAYCAATTLMDAQLDRVLDTLEKHNLWDRTLVTFIGDNGSRIGERKWWKKDTLFERSCRAPLIIAAPGITGGQTTRSLVEFVHLYPTVADFCGLRLPHPGAGASLKPVMANPATTIKDAAFTLLARGPKLYGQSVRTTRWRFTQWSDGQTELYAHDDDPEESHKVAKANPTVVMQPLARPEKLPPDKPSPSVNIMRR